MGRFQAACVTFVLNYAAYFCEIFRGGILSVESGQYEAAQVLGFTKWQNEFENRFSADAEGQPSIGEQRVYHFG